MGQKQSYMLFILNVFMANSYNIPLFFTFDAVMYLRKMWLYCCEV